MFQYNKKGPQKGPFLFLFCDFLIAVFRDFFQFKPCNDICNHKIIESQNHAVNATTSIFTDIYSSMEVLVEQVNQIIFAIKEMEVYKSQAILAIENIAAVSEEIAASSEEVNASTEEQLAGIEQLSSFAKDLNSASEKLMQSIQSFKI